MTTRPEANLDAPTTNKAADSSIDLVSLTRNDNTTAVTDSRSNANADAKINEMFGGLELFDSNETQAESVAYADGPANTDSAPATTDGAAKPEESAKPRAEETASNAAVDFYEDFFSRVAAAQPEFPVDGVKVLQTKNGNPAGAITREGITAFTTDTTTGLKDTHTVNGLGFNIEGIDPVVTGRVDTKGHEGKVTLPNGKEINFNDLPPETQAILDDYFTTRDGLNKSHTPETGLIEHYQKQLDQAGFSSNPAEDQMIKNALKEFVRGDLLGRFTSFEPEATGLSGWFSGSSSNRPDFELTPSQSAHVVTNSLDGLYRGIGNILESINENMGGH